MARKPNLEPSVPIHLTVPQSVYNYLVDKLAGTQSLASYVLQRSGIIPEYRQWLNSSPVSGQLPQPPVAILETRTCETCQLVTCDPSCPMLAVHETTY